MPIEALALRGCLSMSKPQMVTPPAGLVHQARKDVDHRRLAGPVRAEQPEDLPLRHFQAHALQRSFAALVGLLEVADRDGGCGHAPAHSRWRPQPSIVQPQRRC
jgi:hypothetical protein